MQHWHIKRAGWYIIVRVTELWVKINSAGLSITVDAFHYTCIIRWCNDMANRPPVLVCVTAPATVTLTSDTPLGCLRLWVQLRTLLCHFPFMFLEDDSEGYHPWDSIASLAQNMNCPYWLMLVLRVRSYVTVIHIVRKSWMTVTVGKSEGL